MKDEPHTARESMDFGQYVHVLDGRPVLVFPDHDDALVAYLGTARIPLLPILSDDGELMEDDGIVHGSDLEGLSVGEIAELAAQAAKPAA